MLLLRTHPEAVSNIVVYLNTPDKAQNETTLLGQPADKAVRKMPTSTVPVRRGGSLPGNGAKAPSHDTQTQADAVSAKLRRLNPGG